MNKEILIKFLSNQCSYKECESIARFLEENEHELDKVEIFENLLENDLVHLTQSQKKSAFNLIIPKEKKIITFKRLVIAATILLFSIFSFYKLGLQDNLITPEPWVNITNQNSSSKWFLLPDSSRVKIAPNAQLSYRTDFAKNRELLQKDGEVTYYVYPNDKSPFRVINQGIQTKAIGTIFTIGQFDKNQLRIQLLEGKIVLEDSNDDHSQKVFLNDQATVIIHTGDFTYKLIDEKATNYKKAWDIEKKSIKSNYPLSSIAWSNQVVNFNGVSNADLFSIMERLFSVTIDVENPEIMNGNFTGQLYQNDNIEDLLTIFCQINGCVFSIDENIIRIK